MIPRASMLFPSPTRRLANRPAGRKSPCGDFLSANVEKGGELKTRTVLFVADQKIFDGNGNVLAIPESALRDMAKKFPGLMFDEQTRSLIMEFDLDDKNQSPEIEKLLDQFKLKEPFSIGSLPNVP